MIVVMPHDIIFIWIRTHWDGDEERLRFLFVDSYSLID